MKYPVNYANMLISIIKEQEPAFTPVIASDFLEDEDTLLSEEQLIPLIEKTIDILPQETAGLYVGQRLSMRSWGRLGYAMMTCQTLYEAIDLAMKYKAVTALLIDVDLEITDKNNACITAEPLINQHHVVPFSVESTLAGIQSVLTQLTGDTTHYTELEFSYEVSDKTKRDYHEFFKCPISYNRKQTKAYFILPENKTFSHYDKADAKRFLGYLQSRFKEVTSREIIYRVKTVINNIGLERVNQEKVAQNLNRSVSALCKQLEAEGTTYRKIVDEIRHKTAIDYLSSHDYKNISEIATLCGYSDSSNFRKAFVRWEGKSPSEFMRIHKPE